MALPAPSPQDALDFQFKLQCRLRIFQNQSNEEFARLCNLVATASRFGLVFVGTISKQFQVIQIQDIEELEKDVSEYPCRVVELPSKPLHLSANCDSTKLCVVVERDGCPTAIFYDVLSFLKQQVTILKEIRLSATPNVKVIDTEWNPAIPDIFTACKGDGSLGVYEFKGGALDIHELPAASCATCFCWSPKGKQIAVGSRDGKITQYKPDLKAVKAVNPPPLQGSQSIVSLKWTSSFQFIGIYRESNPGSQSFLIIIDAPKTGNPVYTNYDDICYSYGDTRPQQFYMTLEQHWNVLMVTSSNSMEVGVLSNESDKWLQWILGDACRAELPLGPTKQDTLPVGVALNTGTTQALGCGEKSLPVSPMLLLLSNQGLLCCFYAINTKPGAPTVCSPPEPVADKSGLGLFTKHAVKQEPAKSIPVSKPLLPTPPVQPVAPSTNTTPNVSQSSFFGGGATQPPLFNTPPMLKPPSTSLFGSNTTQSSPFVGGPNPSSFGGATPTTPQGSSLFGGGITLNESTSQVQNLVLKPVSQSAPNLQQAAAAPLNKVVSISTLSTTETASSLDTSKSQTPSKRGQDGRLIVNKETEVMIAKLIHEECLTLEAELKALLHSCREVSVNVVSDNEVAQMVQQCNSMHEFLKALTETSAGQAGEIHSLKQSVIQTWAWYEEARSRFNSSQDPALTKVLQGRPLDPASQQQLEDINHLIYYLDSQLLQANNSLDEQWENFQDSLSKNKKIQVPTMEAIYQSMVKQNATIQKEKFLLKDIASRVKTHKRNQTGNILISLDNVDDLQEELDKLKLFPDECTPQVHYKRILERQQKLTKQKSEKLFKFFSNRNATHISVSKPQLNNSTAYLTTLLAVPLSPIALEKKPQHTKPDFIMSTPKPPERVPLFRDPPNNLTVIFDRSKGICPTSTPIVKPKENKDLRSDSKSILKIPEVTTNKPPTTFNISSSGPTVKTETLGFTSPPASKSWFGAPVTAPPQLFGNKTLQSASKGSIFIPTPTTVVAKSTFSFASVSTVSSTSIATQLTNPSTASLLLSTASSITSTNDSVKSSIAVPSTTYEAASITVIKSPAPTLTFSTSLFGSSGPKQAAKAAGTSAFTITPISKPTPTLPAAVNVSSMSDVSKTSTSIFGVSPNTSITQVKTTAASVTATTAVTSVFGVVSSSVAPSGAGATLFVKPPDSSVFGVKSPSTTPLFGSPASTKASIFSYPTAAKTTQAQGSIFGTAATTNVTVATITPNAGMFGGAAPTTPSTPILEGASPAAIPVTSAGFFGGISAAATTSANVSFGSVATMAPNTGSFGGVQTVASAATSTGVFGAVSSTAPSTSSTVVFGAATPITSNVSSTTVQNVGMFGGASVGSTTTNAGIFGGAPTTTGSFGGVSTPAPPTSTSTGNFGGPQSTATSTVLFGDVSTTVPVTTNAGIFGGSVPATATITGIFATTSTSTPGIVTPSTTTNVTSAGLFAGTPTTTSGMFGNAPAPTTIAANSGTFGGGTTATPTATTTTTQSSIFAGGATTSPFGSTTSAPLFGTGNATTTTQSSVFGATPTTSAFGPAGMTTAAAFGGQPAGSDFTSRSPFTAPTTTSFPAESPFGLAKQSAFGGGFGATATTTGPLFGQPAAFGGNSTSGGSIFGGGASTTSNSVFGNTTSTFGSNANTTAFGAATTAASPFGGGSVFGTTTNTNSPFGTAAPATSPFAQTNNAFASKPASFGGGFAGNNTAAFGFNTLNVGNTATTTSSGAFGAFGQQAAPNPFNRGNPQEQKSPFSGGALFGTPTTTAAASIFGGSSPFNKPTAPAFGSPPSFGQQTAGFGQPAFGQSTAFGNSGGFGSPTQGAFSGGGQSIQQTGFGSPAFQKPAAGFGSPSVFGNTPQGFGSPPSFGGSPSFGATGTFGTPQKVFGAPPTAESNFGTVPQNPTFGNLATQNTLGFGNLAQQAASPPPAQPSSFSGGSSFSSWR